MSDDSAKNPFEFSPEEIAEAKKRNEDSWWLRFAQEAMQAKPRWNEPVAVTAEMLAGAWAGIADAMIDEAKKRGRL